MKYLKILSLMCIIIMVFSACKKDNFNIISELRIKLPESNIQVRSLYKEYYLPNEFLTIYSNGFIIDEIENFNIDEAFEFKIEESNHNLYIIKPLDSQDSILVFLYGEDNGLDEGALLNEFYDIGDFSNIRKNKSTIDDVVAIDSNARLYLDGDGINDFSVHWLKNGFYLIIKYYSDGTVISKSVNKDNFNIYGILQKIVQNTST